jgi:hypothetical protein
MSETKILYILLAVSVVFNLILAARAGKFARDVHFCGTEALKANTAVSEILAIANNLAISNNDSWVLIRKVAYDYNYGVMERVAKHTWRSEEL